MARRIFNRHVATDLSPRPTLPAADPNWRRIPGHPDYECNREGTIRRATPGPHTHVGKIVRQLHGGVNLGKTHCYLRAADLTAATWGDEANFQGYQVKRPRKRRTDAPPAVADRSEEWRTIIQAPDYEINQHGTIRRATPGSGSQQGRVIQGAADAPWRLTLQNTFFLRADLFAAAWPERPIPKALVPRPRRPRSPTRNAPEPVQRAPEGSQTVPEPILLTAATVAMAWRVSYPVGKALEALESGDLPAAMRYLQMEVGEKTSTNQLKPV